MASPGWLRRLLFISSALLFISPVFVWAQDESGAQTPETSPAGAQAQQKKKNPWNVWENKAFSVTFIFTPVFDASGFVQDAASEEQVGDQPAKGQFRAERLIFFGKLNFKRPWGYMFAWNFNGFEAAQGNRFSNLDARLDIPLFNLGTLKIGRQKVGLSQEWLMPGVDMVFMERSTTDLAFVPQRNVGVMLTNTFAHKRGLWSAGWFNDWYAHNLSFEANGNQYTGRVSYLPVDRDQGKTIVQVAAALFYKEAQDGKLRFRARPEINAASYFLDTKSFPADHSTTTQLEATVQKGRSMIWAALDLTPVAAPQAHNPFFWGGYMAASRVLAGEPRHFNRANGYYTAVKPPRSRLFRGGWGSWEVGMRYTYTDLSSGTIDGGRMGRWEPALSWYPWGGWRLEFNYGYSYLVRGGTTGYTHGFSGRIQWSPPGG
jgi:phosphate-selective porin OprO/OprP